MFSSNPLNSFFDLEKEKDAVYFNNHHDHNHNPFFSTDCFGSFPPHETQDLEAHHEKLQVLDQEGVSGLQNCDDYNDLLESIVYPPKKKVVTQKKDGHSKIYTAQGPRDRRVRLSIDIARKFFVLQDLLGFDKASKTLDWLFSKSKKAIKELVEETKNSSSSFVTTNQCEIAFLETINGGSEEDKGHKKFLDGERKKVTQKYKSGVHARDQSRAEARARARERTKQKMKIKEMDNESKKFTADDFNVAASPSNVTLQSSSSGRFESQSDYNEFFRESMLEERFSVSSSTLYTYNQNFVVSDEWISQISTKDL